MQPRLTHRWVAEILRDGSAPVLTGELSLDWIPALEWAHLQRVRRDAGAPTALPSAARLCPAWDSTAGTPYVTHVNVRFDASGPQPAPAPGASSDAEPAQRIPLAYFAGAVQRAVTDMVERGQVGDGDEYQWRICAYPVARAAFASTEQADDASFDVVETTDGARLPEVRDLEALLARSVHHGPCDANSAAADLLVLFAPAVLREAAAAATAAGTLETGGVLLGKLARVSQESGQAGGQSGGQESARAGELVLQISAQVPAREAIADDASLRFTADTWAAVHAAIRLRRADEQILGWWHSHPAALWLCRNCPPERRAGCASNRAFFSTMDCGFHRTAFQAAHHVALLLSFLDDPAPRFDLFGWRHGLVCARGWHTLEESA